MVLFDNYGRPLLNFRIALTKRCNLSCQFCHREGEPESETANRPEMTVGEVARIIKLAVKLGVTRVKLTGGEPLVRSDIVEIVKQVAEIEGLQDLSMTTNGTMLEGLARDLKTAGLKRVNISLPTLDKDTYEKLTGGNVETVLGSVKKAVNAGFDPVKLNMPVLKEVNENCIVDMMRFAGETGASLQLIELEPVGVSREYYLDNHSSLDDFEGMLQQKATSIETRRFMQNRHVYRLPDVTVETVRPIENTEFCQHCARLRLTSEGKLKPCLMRNDNLTDILTPMRNGATDEELVRLFTQANLRRRPFNEK